MTLAATTENASSLDSDPTVQSGSGIGAGGEARQAGESVLSGKQPLTLEGKKDEARPWWKTRGAYISYAVAAVVLLVLFVVLLVLGLLGYLEVGGFSSFFSLLTISAIVPLPECPLSCLVRVAVPSYPTSLDTAAPTHATVYDM